MKIGLFKTTNSVRLKQYIRKAQKMQNLFEILSLSKQLCLQVSSSAMIHFERANLIMSCNTLFSRYFVTVKKYR